MAGPAAAVVEVQWVWAVAQQVVQVVQNKQRFLVLLLLLLDLLVLVLLLCVLLPLLPLVWVWVLVGAMQLLRLWGCNTTSALLLHRWPRWRSDCKYDGQSRDIHKLISV
jgi:hypothetical protein